MARCTRRRESALVGILVAGSALCERDSHEFDEWPRSGRLRNAGVAFRAGDPGVASVQDELRGRMIELSNILPAGSNMAALTSGAELSLVFVDVTGTALAAQAEISPLKVLHPDALPLCRLHARWVVAARAG